MSWFTPTKPEKKNKGGSGSGVTVCCYQRKGSREIAGDFSTVFRKYGRAKAWFASKTAATASGPDDWDWEDYYYSSDYRYKIEYDTVFVMSGQASGVLFVTLRCNATRHVTDPALKAEAPGLFDAVTDAVIETAFEDWDAAVQQHWSARNYTVHIDAPDCPGDFSMSFWLEQASGAGDAHVSFTVLKMRHPNTDATFAAALTDPSHAKHATARALAVEWRSNAGKFNLGDARGPLVFAHEFGHWMGWGDEYIEQTGTMDHPGGDTDAHGAVKQVAYEQRGSSRKSLRVAVWYKNPTRQFYDSAGTDQAYVIITGGTARHWLMSSMMSPQTHPARSVYTIVHDFVRIYNEDHYGGGSDAYCVKVT